MDSVPPGVVRNFYSGALGFNSVILALFQGKNKTPQPHCSSTSRHCSVFFFFFFFFVSFFFFTDWSIDRVERTKAKRNQYRWKMHPDFCFCLFCSCCNPIRMQRLATTCTKGEHLSLICQLNTVTFGVTAFMLDPMHFIWPEAKINPSFQLQSESQWNA